jgi:hypothetical protein
MNCTLSTRRYRLSLSSRFLPLITLDASRRCTFFFAILFQLDKFSPTTRERHTTPITGVQDRHKMYPIVSIMQPPQAYHTIPPSKKCKISSSLLLLSSLALGQNRCSHSVNRRAIAASGGQRFLQLPHSLQLPRSLQLPVVLGYRWKWIHSGAPHDGSGPPCC